ncbi:helix-turn-helix domain-containing protein [Nocardioides sp. AN3]
MTTYYTLAEASDRMKVSPETLKRAIYAGRLRGKKTGDNGGGNYLFSDSALDAWFDGLMDA